MNTPRESTIERKLVEEARRRGWLCIKLHTQSVAGLPDRMLLGPAARIAFVELKKKGQKPRPLQRYIHTKFRDLGFPVIVLDDDDDLARCFDIQPAALSEGGD